MEPDKLTLPVVGSRSTGGYEGYAKRVPAVVGLLRRRGPSTRAVIAQALGLPGTTLNRTAKLMVEQQIVTTGEQGPLRDQLWLHPRLGILVGVAVTHRTATAAVSYLDYRLPEGAVPAEREIDIENPEESLRQIAELVAECLNISFTEEEIAERLIGVGIALPGPILRVRNEEKSVKGAAEWDRQVKAGFILPNWDGVDVGARLARRLMSRHGIRPPRFEERRFVWVENDASAGALGVFTEVRKNFAAGQYKKRGRKGGFGESLADDAIYVRVSSGIGAGIVNKGHLVTGAQGFAGELGHAVVDPGGRLCPGCGGRGCLETFASNRAVMEQLGALFPDPDPQRSRSDDATEAAMASKAKAQELHERLERVLEEPHPAVDRALADAGWHVGNLLANVCSLLNPSAIVFGGEMPEYRSIRVPDAEAVDGARPFVDSARRGLEKNAMQQVTEKLEVLTWDDIREPGAVFTPELLGALALVVDHLGDAYLLPPIRRWVAEGRLHGEAPDFAELCFTKGPGPGS